jgi:small subunit ribosomal protein S17
MTEETQEAAVENAGEGNRVRHRKEREGVVIKAGGTESVVVQVTRRVRHPRYKKYVTRRKRYAAHDLIGVEVGEFVKIRETRPLSKTKRWRVVGRTIRHS